MLRMFALIAGFCLAGQTALAEKHALIIANGKYDTLPALEHAAQDGRAYHRLFADAGFSVTLATDADLHRMQDLIRAFTDRLQPDDTAVFVFSGHGMSAEGYDMAVPTDATSADLAEFKRDSINVSPWSAALSDLRQTAHASLVILDMARDNPFAQPIGTQRRRAKLIKSSLTKTGPDPALAPEYSGDARGQIILYATQVGSTGYDSLRTADGEIRSHVTSQGDRTSLFAGHLIDALTENGTVEQAFAKAQLSVFRATRQAYGPNHAQTPAITDGLPGQFCLSTPCTTSQPKAAE